MTFEEFKTLKTESWLAQADGILEGTDMSAMTFDQRVELLAMMLCAVAANDLWFAENRHITPAPVRVEKGHNQTLQMRKETK